MRRRKVLVALVGRVGLSIGCQPPPVPLGTSAGCRGTGTTTTTVYLGGRPGQTGTPLVRDDPITSTSGGDGKAK